MVFDPERVEFLLLELPVRCDVLMGGAGEPPHAVAAHQAHDGVVEDAPVAQEIGVAPEYRQRSVLSQRHVGVEQEQVVGCAVCQLHQLGAVVTEVDPRTLVQRAGDVGERCSDQLLRAVGRARVADRPGVDELTHRLQTASGGRGG